MNVTEKEIDKFFHELRAERKNDREKGQGKRTLLLLLCFLKRLTLAKVATRRLRQEKVKL